MAACTIANVKAHSVVRRILQNYWRIVFVGWTCSLARSCKAPSLAQVLEGKELSRAPALFFKLFNPTSTWNAVTKSDPHKFLASFRRKSNLQVDDDIIFEAFAVADRLGHPWM